MLKSTRISRKSTCRLLNLPLELVCSKCRPGIEKIALGRKTTKKFKSFLQHWDAAKYSSHQDQLFVMLHQRTLQYLGQIVIEGDELVIPTCTDNSQQKKKKTSRSCPSIFRQHCKTQMTCQPYHQQQQHQQAHQHLQPSHQAKIILKKNHNST